MKKLQFSIALLIVWLIFLFNIERVNNLVNIRSYTYIFVAGYEKINDMLNKAFSRILGSEEKWQLRKAELVAGKKWAEIIY